MRKTGVTGGIGSGKTLICQVFEKLGVPVFYADQQARQIYDEDAQVKEAMIEYFGSGLYGPSGLRRDLLASKIFNDPEALRQVNSLVHPAVKRRFLQWCDQQKGAAYVIEEAAILFETGSHKDLDHTILVYAPEQIRVQRVMKRDGVDEEAVRARMAHQMSDEKKIDQAGSVIYNDGSRLV
ncbi:MAG TPA: dephospho-CoA kinase, partial [Bacteroidales bacterium]|nr:dephospho-CoA kinase [Bacteroidales bacterium]